MNNNTYIQEMTNEELLETIRESGQLDEHQKKLLDVDLCMEELSRRGKYAKLLTRADIVRALNQVDMSAEFVMEDYYVITGEQLLAALGLEV